MPMLCFHLLVQLVLLESVSESVESVINVAVVVSLVVLCAIETETVDAVYLFRCCNVVCTARFCRSNCGC